MSRARLLMRAWRRLAIGGSSWARPALDGSGDCLICEQPPEVGPVRVIARARTEREAWVAAAARVAP